MRQMEKSRIASLIYLIRVRPGETHKHRIFVGYLPIHASLTEIISCRRCGRENEFRCAAAKNLAVRHRPEIEKWPDSFGDASGYRNTRDNAASRVSVGHYSAKRFRLPLTKRFV